MIEIKEDKRIGKYIVIRDKEIIAKLSLVEIQAIADFYKEYTSFSPLLYFNNSRKMFLPATHG